MKQRWPLLTLEDVEIAYWPPQDGDEGMVTVSVYDSQCPITFNDMDAMCSLWVSYRERGKRHTTGDMFWRIKRLEDRLDALGKALEA